MSRPTPAGVRGTLEVRGTPDVRGRAAPPGGKSEAMARQIAKATADAEKSGGNAEKLSSLVRTKVAGQGKTVLKKPSVTAATPKPAISTAAPSPEDIAKRHRDAQFKALVDPAAQEVRKRQHMEAFRKLKTMPMEELQVEFIVCIRAQHYKDALMYSEIMLEKDPNNVMVAQFQPLLASMAVQANERLCESSDSDSDGTDGEGGGSDADDGEEQAGGKGNAEDDEQGDSDSDSDDPETAWMWSDTWRTDPDDDETKAPANE